MKNKTRLSFLRRILSLLALSASLGTTIAFADGQTWDGPGTWDVGNTQNWNGSNTWTNGNYAYFFNGTQGAVTVSDQGGAAPVIAQQMYFSNNNGGADYTFSGSSISTADDNTPVYIDANNTENVTFNNEIILNETNHNFVGDQSNFSNNTAKTLTLGAIDVEDTNNEGFGYQLISLNQAAGGTINLAGPITAGIGSAILFGINSPSSPTGTYEISNTIQSGIGIAIYGSQTLLLNTDTPAGGANLNIIGSDYTTPTRILTVGARTINNPIGNQNDKADEFGGSTADQSNFNGVLSPFATVTLSSVVGGRVNFNNVIQNEVGGGLKTSGSGIITLNNATGNTYGLVDGSQGYTTGTVAAVLGAHYTLINNTSGSAFSNNVNTTVSLLVGAALGGTGISTQPIIAAGATSIIAPGDPGQANLGIAASTGTLTLAGGLDTSNGGVTLDFKINGLDNDKLSFASGDFVPTGDLTVNLFNMGSQDSILSNHYYTLIDPTAGTLDPSGANVNVIAPYGYAVEDVQFGTFTGLEVELIAAPEPSTYALMLGGLGFLAFCLHRKGRKLNA